MKNFADRLYDSVRRNKSCLVAGLDPQIDSMPGCILDKAKKGKTTDESIEIALTSFCNGIIAGVADKVAAVKPNIAFFEQYGLPGLKAFHAICEHAQERSLPVIVDAKVGDIGNTASAYARAFLGKTAVFGGLHKAFHADALTVNPFLGFDTLEPFLGECREHAKGLFVLVRTSNPGSGAVQKMKEETSGQLCFQVIAEWLSDVGRDFIGECGYSSIGAVVGATHPSEAARIREFLPKGLFLIPGLGAQGGTADDAIAGFDRAAHREWIGSVKIGGGIINVSRGLVPKEASSLEHFVSQVSSLTERFNNEVNVALSNGRQPLI